MEDDILPPSKRSKITLDHHNEVVRLVRDKPPAHFTLKLESFSQLQEAHPVDDVDNNHFDSTEFRAGVYRWVLSVYPNGNQKEDGAGHLSLSIRMVDKLWFGKTINVALRFFLHDQIRDNYLTILDLREKRFQTIKNEWGIPKVLHLSVLSDPSSGYLVNDCCVLGAEVVVISAENYASEMSVVKASTDWQYTWRIEKFSELKEKLYSPEFMFEGYSWKLCLFPRGYGQDEEKNLSLYLELDNAFDLGAGSKLFADSTLGCKNQLEGSYHENISRSWFSSNDVQWGIGDFLGVSDVENPEKGYVVDDVMIIKVEIGEMLLLKDIGAMHCDSTPRIGTKRKK